MSQNNMNGNDVLRNFAYFIPAEKFVLRFNDRWHLDLLVGREGLINALVQMGYSADIVQACLKSRNYASATGTRTEPSRVPFVHGGDGRVYLNMYVPPTLQPAPAPYPTIERVLDEVTAGDAKGKAWLFNWIACKVQNPMFFPMVAVVLCSRPGIGKGTLYRIMAEMLGRENGAEIQHRNISNRFNARWVNKLLVLADEILTRETVESTSEILKTLIASKRIEFERKGQDQQEVPNHIAWIFASNDEITPVVVEDGDRRFTVFSNFKPISQEYKALLAAAYDSRTGDPTAAFMAEIAGFMHALLEHKADLGAAKRVYENESRAQLISASQSSSELFFREVETMPGALDELLDLVGDRDPRLNQKDRAQWDLGDAVKAEAVYACYRLFCEQSGIKYPLAQNRFGSAVRAREGWRHFHPYLDLGGGKKKQIHAYSGPWKRLSTKPAAVPASTSNVVPFKSAPAPGA
jgi:hypothetical protein